MVVRKMEIDKSSVIGIDHDVLFDHDAEKYHWAIGGGFRIALNENFIVAADLGKALDERDGGLGVYIGIGYLF